MRHLSTGFLFLGTLVFACSGGNNGFLSGSSKLPENPEKIVIEWSEGGGMLPEGENIYLSPDSSYWNRWRRDYDQRVYFESSPDELNELYEVFKQNKFDRIKLIEEREVYDRGGTNINLQADKEFFSKNNSGLTFIDDNWYEEYNAVSEAIYSFAMRKTENSKIPLRIEFDPSLITPSRQVAISLNGYMIFDSEKNQNLTVLDTLVYPAENEFEVNLFNKDSLNYYGSPAYLSGFRSIEAITAETKTIKLSLGKDEEVIIELK